MIFCLARLLQHECQWLGNDDSVCFFCCNRVKHFEYLSTLLQSSACFIVEFNFLEDKNPHEYNFVEAANMSIQNFPPNSYIYSAQFFI